jgi:putative ABC transport system permease protein
MLKNYFKTAFRALGKNRVFSFINIAGLAIGMASAIMLLGYVTFQFSYDDFHANKKDIYRVDLSLYQNNSFVYKSAENYSAVGPALKKDFPDVVASARLYNMGYKNNCVFTYNNKSFKETKFLYADSSFFTMFSFPFKEGDPQTALAQPFTAVISESAAKKLFGNEDAIGKSIQMDDDDRNSELCKITGVFKDVPENSHIKFNILISYATLFSRRGGLGRYETNWDHKDYYTYVLLRPGTDIKSLEAQLPAFINKHIPQEKAAPTQSVLALQPLQKIHLTANLKDESEATGNEKGVFFLVIISIFILVIAWVNYINLATAGSIGRAKETGIRKVLGSTKAQLINQFLTESLAINLLSFAAALILASLLQPAFENFFNINFSLSALLNNQYGLVFIFFIIAGSFLSGLYPAFVLSSFKPTQVLKGKLSTSAKGLALRRFLVIFQFSLSIFLIIGTLVVYRQVHFMLTQNLGMQLNQVLVMDRPGRWEKSDSLDNTRVQRFKEMLLHNPAIESVAMSDEIPGREIRFPLNFTVKGSREDKPLPFITMGIDEDFLHTLNMNLLAGRSFSPAFKTDGNGLIITASAAELLGFRKPADAIGKQLVNNYADYSILGVANDFHQMSLEKKAERILFQYSGSYFENNEYYLVKLKTANIPQSVEYIQNTWNDVFKGNPFGYFFLDEFFNRQYKNEQQFGVLFGMFSIIAIVIACIGLFALVAFMVQQRTKEIGVRKVLGASIQDITLLLTKQFIQLILIANVIAWPLGWLLMNNWLTDFVYRINISWWMFVLAGVSALVIALVTISFQAIKAALMNPVTSLRTE